MDKAGALERARIARDLHDAIGHHLTAMTLHLDLAKRQSAGKVTELLQAAHALAQRLLAEVRKVVSAERVQSGDRK
jgi:signal transduction histidine kinase